ncbi:Olfactory receptor 6N2 [Lemmus lemmus]
MDQHNFSSLSEFVLLGFPKVGHIRGCFFVLLLLAYLFTIGGNTLIFLVIRLDAALHKPMYHFVSVLSFLELWYTATTIPKMLANLLSEKKTISFAGCLLQTYFFHSLGASECYLLTAMAYDRYLAICRPLHYPSIMTTALCVKMAAGCWTCGFLCPISELPFCGPNHIQHIFCDFPPVLSLACTDTSVNVLVDFIVNSCKILATFLLILSSYLQIIRTVLRIPSAAGKKKAFSTCASHLTVVLIFYGSILFMYVRLKKSYSLDYDRALALEKIIALMFAVLAPFFNPIIYSLRNKDMKDAIKKVFCSQKPFTVSGI